MIYKKIVKPIFFKIDPEKIHDIIVSVGNNFGKIVIIRKFLSLIFNYENEMLKQNVCGISFKNPIGLAAGFDKDAKLMQVLPSVGFGFEEIGSVTAKPCKGNLGKRLWRIPKYNSLVVYYGLKNQGVRVIEKKLKNKKFKFPIGISIAKTNCRETVDSKVGLEDYLTSFVQLQNYADYITINISCPNSYGGEDFASPELLNELLREIEIRNQDKPIFLKISPELTNEHINQIIDVCEKYKVAGFVISNLIKNRDKINIPKEEFEKVGVGGISGKVLQKKSNELISYVYKKTNGKYIIIGCGGIFDANDAYEKIKNGATLVQLITGMIFEGPAIIKKINKELVQLLKKDGYNNISEAIGINV